jgi:hypothetical protein
MTRKTDTTPKRTTANITEKKLTEIKEQSKVLNKMIEKLASNHKKKNNE